MAGNLYRRFTQPKTAQIFTFSLAVVVAVAVACSGGGEQTASPTATTVFEQAAIVTSETPGQEPSATPEAGASQTSDESLFVSPTEQVELTDLVDSELARAQRWQLSYNWFTDFNTRTVDLTEIDNLLPRDRIKPVDDPQFVTVSDPPDYMRKREPVIAVEIGGDARAYPLAILMWQEIVNDTVGGVPVTVTFCPLCNTAITFQRTLEGHELTFGTSGNLRNSDLVMWDRQTESWWQQITGEAIVGKLAGKVLKQVPSPIIAWETFQSEYPDGKLLLREVDSIGAPIRPYDDPPYAGYDSVDTNPFAFTGVIDERLPANLRVLTVKIDDATVAYPFPFLEQAPLINDDVGGEDVAIFFDNGTLSAFLDERSSLQTSGSTTMFHRDVDGHKLTFQLGSEGITDVETGSVWSIVGKATSGQLTGTQLEPVIHQNHFWFAWAVFEPETVIRDSDRDVAGPVSSVVE